MIQHMKLAEQHRAVPTRDAYGDTRMEHQPLRTILVAISTRSGSPQTMSSVISVNSTHTGITDEADIQRGDILVQAGRRYKVDYIPATAPRTVLDLSLVEDAP
ncbi:MAG: hypothetical protein PHT58_07235 [Eubacteriales bacterium]|nr:hypothetical protein [Eubacteriales bacterium]